MMGTPRRPSCLPVSLSPSLKCEHLTHDLSPELYTQIQQICAPNYYSYPTMIHIPGSHPRPGSHP